MAGFIEGVALKVCQSFLITILVIFCASLAKASADPEILWQLHPKDGHPADCKLTFTQVVQDSKSQPSFQSDCRMARGDWHSCVTTKPGLLKAGEDYVVTINYEIIDRSDQGSYFYVFARSRSLGLSADKWCKWLGEAGSRGVAKLRISPTAADYIITTGILQPGSNAYSVHEDYPWHWLDNLTFRPKFRWRKTTSTTNRRAAIHSGRAIE